MTSSMTPDLSSGLSSAVPTQDPSQPQGPPAPQPAQQVIPPAPDVSSVQPNGPRVSSLLARIVSPQPSPPPATSTPAPQPAWKRAIGTAARVVSTGLAGIPAGGRPSFLGGLGQGARAEQQEQAQQQAIKFKSFDDQVRMAELHNQDLKMQNDTQEQQDAHTKADLEFRQYAEDHGVDYDTIANHGGAVMDHLTAQTQANGAASVPAGTYLSGDGKSINIPQDTQKTRDGQKAMYSDLAPALGLPGLPEGASFVPPKLMNMLTNKVHGFTINGEPIKHDDLPGVIAAEQTQRDTMAKSGASDTQLTAMDNRLGILKANLSALDKHADDVKQSGSQATEQGKISAQMSPEGRALAASNEKLKEQAQDNAAGNKPVKPTNTDWNPGVGADEKKKAELAENIAFNANEVAKIVMKRPDILGAVAGRYTNAEQMIGNNDPDISALGVHVHNMAMANSGVHGFRSQEGVESYERQLLNNFKNGPAAMAGALRASTGSVQTFIDNARPQTYKTHSNQGGAVKGMMGAQQ